MKRMGSASASVVVLVVLLASFSKVGCETNVQSTKNISTMTPSVTTNRMLQEQARSTADARNIQTQQQRSMRDSYRRSELPVFGAEDIESRISDNDTRNRTRDDDAVRHNILRPPPINTKDTKKSSSSVKSASSTKSSAKSSKKSSKREGEFYRHLGVGCSASNLVNLYSNFNFVSQEPTSSPIDRRAIRQRFGQR